MLDEAIAGGHQTEWGKSKGMRAQSPDLLAEGGDCREAVRLEQRALEVQRVDPAFEERLALYLKGAPYHEPEPTPGAEQKQHPPE